MSVSCSEAGKSASHTELAGGRWSTSPQENEAGTVESALQSSRLAVRACAPVSCSVLLFWSIQNPFNHTWSLFACAKAYSALKTGQHPHFHTPKRVQWCKNPAQWKMIGQQNNPTSLYNKKEQCSSYIFWILHCLKYFSQCLTTVSLFPHNHWASFPSHRSIQQNLKHIRKDWDILLVSPTKV